jgi:hypothetical protein
VCSATLSAAKCSINSAAMPVQPVQWLLLAILVFMIFASAVHAASPCDGSPVTYDPQVSHIMPVHMYIAISELDPSLVDHVYHDVTLTGSVAASGVCAGSITQRARSGCCCWF